MADKPYEAEDPLAPVAVVIPGDEDSVAEMGRCFVDEFVRMGWRRNALLAVFRDPFFQGPYLVYRKMGEEWVETLVDEALAAGNGAGVRREFRTG